MNRKHRNIIVFLLALIICAAAGILLLLWRMDRTGQKNGDGSQHFGVTADMAETEVSVLSDRVFYRDIPEERLVFDAESGMPYVNDELQVSAAEGVSWEQLRELLSDYSPRLAGYNEASDTYEVCLDGSWSEAELLALGEELEAEDEVEWAEPNYWLLAPVSETEAENGENQESGGNTGDGAGAGLAEMGKSAERSTLDSMEVQTDWLHPKTRADWGLDAVKADELWRYGVMMKDPVRVGVWDHFSDSLTHEDLTFEASVGTGTAGENHGMHVSGILAAEHNGRGVMGMAPEAEVTAYQISGGVDVSLESGSLATCASLQAELTDMIDTRKLRVINVSLSFEDYAAPAALGNEFAREVMSVVNHQLESHLEALIRRGNDFLICKGAGNLNSKSCREANENDSEIYQRLGYVLDDGGDHSLQNLECASWDFLSGIEEGLAESHIIVVGAMREESPGSENYVLTDFSVRGDRIDIAAPGYSIYSLASGGGYTTMDGTSMATPYVSGAAAALFSMDDRLTASTLKTYLEYGDIRFFQDDAGGMYPALDMENTLELFKRTATGKVTDAASGEGIGGTLLEFNYGDTDTPLETVRSGMDGSVSLGLLMGNYELRVSADGYETAVFQVNVDENAYIGTTAVSLPDIRLEKKQVSVWLPGEVQQSGDTVYLSTYMNGGSDPARIPAGTEPVTNLVVKFIKTDTLWLQTTWNSSSGPQDGGTLMVDEGENVYTVASDVCLGDEFALIGEQILYVNVDGDIICSEKDGSLKRTVFHPADYGISPPDWAAYYKMAAADGFLYFMPYSEDGRVYRMDLLTFEVVQCLNRSAQGIPDSAAADSTWLYYTVSDSLVRERLDGSGGETVDSSVEYSNIFLDNGILYYLKDGNLVGWNTSGGLPGSGDGSLRTVAENCGRIAGVAGGRIYYCRADDSYGVDSYLMYYSCLPDGTDEVCHGVWQH